MSETERKKAEIEKFMQEHHTDKEWKTVRVKVLNEKEKVKKKLQKSLNTMRQ